MTSDPRLDAAKTRAELAIENISANSHGFFFKANIDAFKIAAENASKKSKHQKIIKLLDTYSDITSQHAVCQKGCNHCCHVSVAIYETEAKAIEQATGRMARKAIPDLKKLPPANQNNIIKRHFGTPCPFLIDRHCSIYDHRPIACRIHFNLGDPYYCDTKIHPSMSYVIEPNMSTVTSAIKEAFHSDILADIRDFFPQHK